MKVSGFYFRSCTSPNPLTPLPPNLFYPYPLTFQLKVLSLWRKTACRGPGLGSLRVGVAST